MSSLVKVAEQAVTYDLVKIENGSPIAVTSYLDEYVKALSEHQEDSVKNDIDVDVVVEKIKEAKDTFKGVKTYRLGFTNPFKSVTSEFTDREKNILSIITGWEQHLDKMREETFKVAEATIRVELNKLLDENQDLGLTITPFESFIQVQRKVKGMLPSEKTGKLSKASLKKIDETFEEIAEPIRKAKALEELKETEAKRFDVAINSFKINSNDITILKDILLDLAKQSETVEELYPNIHEYCTTRLRNTYSQVQSNIKALESESKRVEAEAKAKALKDADLPILEKANDIGNNIDANAHSKEWLDRQLQALNDLLEQLSFKENIQTISNIKERIFTKLSLLVTDELDEESNPFEEEVTEMAKEVIEEPTIYEVDFRVNTTLDKVKLLKAYALSIGVELKSI